MSQGGGGGGGGAKYCHVLFEWPLTSETFSGGYESFNLYVGVREHNGVKNNYSPLDCVPVDVIF
jgi:hypothetical protein